MQTCKRTPLRPILFISNEQASTRELCMVILFGMCLSYVSSLFLLMKPCYVSCYMTRIFPGLSFALIFGALAVKTNRIYRLLSVDLQTSLSRPRFLSSFSQVGHFHN